MSSRVAIEREYKDYGFGDNAKIFFGFYAMVALAAKVLALVVFFTPALKLFRFDTHARSALIPFHTTLGNMSGENLLANTAARAQLSHFFRTLPPFREGHEVSLSLIVQHELSCIVFVSPASIRTSDPLSEGPRLS